LVINEVRIDKPDENNKTLRIQEIVDIFHTPEGHEFHLIPLPNEVEKIKHVEYNTTELFATKYTVSNFIGKLDGKFSCIRQFFNERR
jgi:hypothetical protein